MKTNGNKSRTRNVLTSAALGLLMFGGFALAGGLGVVPGSGIVHADPGDGAIITRITRPDPEGRACEGDVYLDRAFSGTVTLQLLYETGGIERGFGGRPAPEYRDSGLRTAVTFDGQAQAHYSFPSCAPAEQVKSYRIEVDEASLPYGMSPRMAYREDDSYGGDREDKDHKEEKHCTTTATKTVTTTKLLTTTVTATKTITLTTTSILTTTVTVTKTITALITQTITKILTSTVTKTVTASDTTTTKTTTSSTYTKPKPDGWGSLVPGGADVDRRGLLAAVFTSL